MTVRRVFGILGLLIGLVVVAFWYWQQQQQPTLQFTQPPSATTQSSSVFTTVRPDSVIADGVVVPAQYATLSFMANGSLATWLQPEGAQVTAGTVLAHLSAPQLSQSVSQAGAGLRVAQARLDQARNGARPEEIASAEAALAGASAQQEVAQAQLAQAKANQAAAQAQVQEATAVVDAAQARLQEAARGATDEEKRSAQARLSQAEAAVRQAQAAYDRVAARSDVSALPESRTLEQATQAQEIAQAEYDQVMKGTPAEELAQLRANERQAQAAAIRAQAGVEAAAAALRQAQANVNAARAAQGQTQAHLDMLRNGATAEELAILEAQVHQARAVLLQALELEGQMTLAAPFDGTLAHQLVRAGEPVAPNQPVARFGDLSRLLVETDDLDEIDAALVRAGQAVEVSFDALPDVRMPGRVHAIRSVAEEKRGETTFTVQVDLDEIPEGLLWGMTASVEIFVDS